MKYEYALKEAYTEGEIKLIHDILDMVHDYEGDYQEEYGVPKGIVAKGYKQSILSVILYLYTHDTGGDQHKTTFLHSQLDPIMQILLRD